LRKFKVYSFAGVCDVKFPKMFDDCETLVLVLSLPVGESNFGRTFFFCRLFVVTLVRLFFLYYDIFPPRFNVANDIVLLIFKMN